MAQPPLHLIIGNYNTSPSSLRAWLVLRTARLAFAETRIPLRLPETPDRIGHYSPSGKLPVLLAEGVPIWDSLAIAEFVAELEPGIWPLDPIARAEARSISAEIHSGFGELRRLMPMDVVGRFNAPGRLPHGLAAEIRRVTTICEHCRARFAAQGPFLFGAFSIADAMMAPIASRLSTHGVPIDGALEDYVDSVMAWPDMVTWCDAAAAEQAERVSTGSLALVSVTRPGRVLGPEAAAVEAAPSAAVDENVESVPGEPAVAPVAATAEPEPNKPAETAVPPAEEPVPSAEEPVSIEPTATGRDQVSADSVPGAGRPPTDELGPDEEVSPQRAAVRLPETTASASPAPATPVSPPRRRLFEPAPPAGSEPPRPMALPDAGDTEAPATSAAPEAKPSRKLGWLRRGVPADHFEQIEPPVREDQTHGVADREPPAARPATADDRPESPRAAEEIRQSAPGARPTTPAIKPIGGGIHRRR